MEKKILILGASVLQVPAIKKAKEKGLYVIVADIDANAPGIEYADKFYNVSTLDFNKIHEVVEREKIDGLLTIASDRPMPIISKIGAKFNFNTLDLQTAINTTNKGKMREILANNNILIPVYKVFSLDSEPYTYIANTKFPVIIKPTNNSGSRGVVLLKSEKNEFEIKEAIHYARLNSVDGEIIVEEFMEGPEVSVESITLNGKCHVIAITDKITTGPPYFVEMGHSQPSRLSNNIKEKIIRLTKLSTIALGIKNGVSHTEIIITNEGPKIVEIGARLGGDNITTHLTPLSTGIDMVGVDIDLALGNQITIPIKKEKASAIRYIKNKPGLVTKISGVVEATQIQGIIEVYLNIQVGDQVSKVRNSNDRIGYIISSAENINEAEAAIDKAFDKLKIEIN